MKCVEKQTVQVQEPLNTDLHAAAVQPIRDHILGKHTSDQASGEAIQLELINHFLNYSYIIRMIINTKLKVTGAKESIVVHPPTLGLIKLPILTEKRKAEIHYIGHFQYTK